MQTLARLFGQSPFAPLQAHLEVVAFCVRHLIPLFSALQNKKYDEVHALVQAISDKEYQADCIKNDMRNHLPIGLFMPISRAAMLEIISIQDCMADIAEDVAILLTARPLTFYPEFESLFLSFLHKNVEAFDLTVTVIQEFNKLLESSFGGRRADKVRTIVSRVAKAEHACDVLQRDLMQVLFSDDFTIPVKEFYLWLQVIKKISGISDSAEKLAHRINMTLEEK